MKIEGGKGSLIHLGLHSIQANSPSNRQEKGCGGGSEECLSKPRSPGMRKVYIDAYGVAGTGTPLYQSGVSVQTGPHQHNRISVTSNNVDLEGKYFHSPNR